MSDQNPNEFDAPAEEATNTADVRDAIQRARESAQQPEQPTESAPAEPIAAEPVAPVTSEPVTQEPAPEQPTVQETVMMPSANEEVVAAPVQPATPEAPAGEQVSISADHPMAALYMQQPDPPKKRSNRLAGFFISILATVGFALVYAAGLALWLAPVFPPSTFLQEGLYPYLVSLSFVIPVAAFFVMLVLYVLIFNRTGWWLYAVFGSIIAAVVWVGAAVGMSMSPQLAAPGDDAQHNIRLFAQFLITVPALVAAVAARESAIWFGAWIGARGRRIKQRNAAAQAEYEQQLAELKTPQQL